MNEERIIQRANSAGTISLEDIFSAYFDCRRNKRNTYNALKFEMDYEAGCVALWKQINERSYRPRRSIAFIVEKPVKREVFAADFRDRIVHHLIAKRIEPLFEKQFIEDSYSTRCGKGTLYGIQRVEQHISECSCGGTKDCYVMKIDIHSFFMKLPKVELYSRVSTFLKDKYTDSDLDILLYLIKETIFNCPEKNCIVKSSPQCWNGLPHDKSLFHTDGFHGLPIGNLTSQLLALFYLDDLDHFVTEELGVKYYGRYVDDMVLVHPCKAFLLFVKGRISSWLSEHGLLLHPRKMYLQYYKKGVLFIGGMILPGRKYVSKRTIGFFYDAVFVMNKIASLGEGAVAECAEHFVSVINSYLGLLYHFNARRMVIKILCRLSSEWWKVFYILSCRGKFKAVLRRAFRSSVQSAICVKVDIRKFNHLYDGTRTYIAAV